MKATDILTNEHRVIEQVLNCLEAIVRQARSAGRLDGPSAKDAIVFFRNFADRCHHGKEEDRLFPAMVRKGVPNENGPIGVMLLEHEQGRNFVAAMAAATTALERGEKDAAEDFAFSAEQYVDLLRAHIHKEDMILFPLADRVMNDEEQSALLQQFELVEKEHMGVGTHEKYLKLADSLAQAYGVDRSAIAAVTSEGSCGCHHANH
jgi:hemerythrin-like domain-containing protein